VDFAAFLVEAAGLPFPSRIVLLIAATLAGEPGQLVGLVVVSTVGLLIGDHVPYLAGALTGPRILAFYCRITLGSAGCVEKTVGYFKRFGAAAILMSRFSASVRLFASALSGCGHITYRKFVTFDAVGTLLSTPSSRSLRPPPGSRRGRASAPPPSCSSAARRRSIPCGRRRA
jgi:membrane protein DedA with SNARE-associated domain